MGKFGSGGAKASGDNTYDMSEAEIERGNFCETEGLYRGERKRGWLTTGKRVRK